MTTSAKPQKDKPFGAAPRLAPRQTAASAARAARNATTRNSVPPPRQSPTRSPPSPVSSKVKTNCQRNGQKTDSRTEIKINRNCENVLVVSDLEGTRLECQPSFTESGGTVILDDSSKDHLYPETDDVEAVQEIDTFESDLVDENTFKVEDNHNVLGAIKSKPNNSFVGSRPQTPGSVSSRPQTPRISSRPSTPAHPAQRPGTPVSRPNTPQQKSQLNRPSTPNTPSARPLTPIQGSQIPLRSPAKRDDLKSSFTAEYQQYKHMKRELDLKQQAILEVFKGLRGLRERMQRENIAGGEVELKELMVFNVGDWAAEEVAQLCRDAAAAAASDSAAVVIESVVPVDESALTEVEAKAMNVPQYFADLCLRAFTTRQEIIDWIKNIIVEQNMGDQEMNRIAHYNTQGLELCEALRELKCQANDAVATVTQLSKRAFQERAALIRVGESLVREVARLRHDLEMQVTVVQEVHDTKQAAEATKALEEVRRELNEERAAKNALKDKLATAESQLRQTRIRVSKMDRQLREAEASIASLTGTVKSLEDQSRQKEVHLEARARKLKESLKTGEMASSQLSQQRDALQAEVSQLKEQIQTMNTQHNSTVQELSGQIKELLEALEEERKILAQEREQKEALEKSHRDIEYMMEELKAKIVELENSKLNPELPSEREMDLWAELQATKDILRTKEDEINACKKEKNRFLESLTKISETDDKVGMQHKLAAELMGKEEVVSKMQAQIRELTKNMKFNEQKLIQYEQYVHDLQEHNRSVANCHESPNGTSYQDLQQEIMTLRMSLLETVHKNEELSSLIIQKDQQLEHQDKTSRAQARVIKVREELINLLKSKETEQSRELTTLQQDVEYRMKIVDDVNKQIAAKAHEIQELFATLENKQQQIHRLEKIVLALEEQQRRAQAQRTRQEEKIAALEHELAAGNDRREKKFLFF